MKIPPPSAVFDHERYHALGKGKWPVLSWSGLSRFMGNGVDLGAATFRDPVEVTRPMRWGSLTGRIIEFGTDSPARCGVIAVDAARGSTAWAVLPELVRRLADRFPKGWEDSPLGAPPRADRVEVAVGPNKGRDTVGHRALVGRTMDPGDPLYERLPVTPVEWAQAVEFAGEMLAADPGAWADAPPPMIVTLDEWSVAVAAARSISEAKPGTRGAGARRLLLGAEFREYFAEWTERVEIAEANLVCPDCGTPLGWAFSEDSVPSGLRCEGDSCHNWFPGVLLANPDGVDSDAVVEVPCRLMADAVGIAFGRRYVADLKVVADSTPESAGGDFDRIARQRFYHGQMSWYRRGLSRKWGCEESEIAAYLCPVQNTRPHLANWVPISPELLDEARDGREDGRGHPGWKAGLKEYALRLAGLKQTGPDGEWLPGWQLEDELPPLEPWRGR